ncbi:MAG: HEPN domain-containing protein [Armatimonadetes bacterium]|nr:HEPN domain-containing protein [Armatimonadota bacterium]
MTTAQTDRRTAEVLMASAIYNNAAFHLQQAAEKAMKALLREHGEREPTHSGLQLMSALERLGEAFPEGFAGDLRRLDRCFIDTRYPNGVGGPPEEFYDREMVEELFACCRRVMAYVTSRLS